MLLDPAKKLQLSARGGFGTNVMKTPRTLIIATALSVIPCIAQTSTLPQQLQPGAIVASGNPEENHEKREHALKKLEGMDPAQRAQFLQNHPRLQKYLNNHPRVAERVSGTFSGAPIVAGGPVVMDPGHPRVNEVNRREEHLDDRINHGVTNGTLTGQQAANLDQKVLNIKAQEAKDIAADNGHLTRSEYRQLNREENRVSRDIKRDKKENKSK